MHERLITFGKAKTPPQALDAAERKPDFWVGGEPTTIEWSEADQLATSARFRDFKATWKHVDDAPGLDIWDNAKEVLLGDRVCLEGDCASFVPEFARLLMEDGRPRGALRPVLCTMGRQAHMVLSIETDMGTLIACNLIGLGWLEDNRLARHKWAARHVPGAENAWEDLSAPKIVGLDQLLKGQG